VLFCRYNSGSAHLAGWCICSYAIAVLQGIAAARLGLCVMHNSSALEIGCWVLMRQGFDLVCGVRGTVAKREGLSSLVLLQQQQPKAAAGVAAGVRILVGGATGSR
jgi:hypothetical protein